VRLESRNLIPTVAICLLMKTKTQTKILLLFAAAGLSIASAKTYGISVPDHAVLAGAQVRAGEYRVTVDGTTATLVGEHKQQVAATGAIQPSDKKFAQTQLEISTGNDGTNHIIAIDLGGTNTRLTFNN
jgi:hypothetical protein